VNVHATQAHQPLCNLQVAIPTRVTKGCIADSVNVHTTQAHQPLRNLQVAIPTRVTKGIVVVGVNVHAIETQQPLRNVMGHAMSKTPIFDGFFEEDEKDKEGVHLLFLIFRRIMLS
jgi:hypothetical protein